MAKRVQVDIKKFYEEYKNDSRYQIIQQEDNALSIELHFPGPAETPYFNHELKLKFDYGAEYPFKSPKVTFLTPIYHPNVDFKGEICIDILKTSWTPAMTTLSVFISICSLLCHPQPDSALNGEAGLLLINKRTEEYNRKVQLTYERVKNGLSPYIPNDTPLLLEDNIPFE